MAELVKEFDVDNYTRPCEDCGNPVVGGPAYKRFCNVNCRMRTQKAKSRPRKNRQCGHCDKRLARNPKGDVGYCRDCERMPKWKREGTPGPRQRRALKILKEAARGRTAKRVWIQGNCPWCGTEFMANAKHCSKRCRENERLRQRRPLRFKPSPADREALKARDGNACQLCLRTIDFDLPHPHIWSVTVDHIEPQSHMLIPDHSLPNLRLAHLLCNSIRGDDMAMGAERVRSATEMRWTAEQLASAA